MAALRCPTLPLTSCQAPARLHVKKPRRSYVTCSNSASSASSASSSSNASGGSGPSVTTTSLPASSNAADPGAAAAAAAAAAAGADDRAQAFLQNPAIAQRELARRFFASASSEEQLAVVQSSRELLDVNVSVNLLCHAAELAMRGLMPGSVAQQEALLAAIHANLEAQLPTVQPVHIAKLLWSLAVVGGARAGGADWVAKLLEELAEQELALGRLGGYSTQDLASVIHAYGRLDRRRSHNVLAWVAAAVGELECRMAEKPYVRSAFSATDFADLVQACAALYAPAPHAFEALRADAGLGCSWGGGSSGGSSSSSDGSAEAAAGAGRGAGGAAAGGGAAADAAALPAEVARLLDSIASEVRRQMANKHSLRSPFTPRDLVRFVGGYAALQHRSGVTSQMLDSLGSFVVQRIKSKHLNAVSRPGDLAGLLEAYADLQHFSLVVPELLTAASAQLRRAAAAQQDLLSNAEAEVAAEGAAAVAAASDPVLAAGAAAGTAEVAATWHGRSTSSASRLLVESDVPLAAIASILESHARLGFAPAPLTVQALQPALCRQLRAGAASPAEAGALLQVLAEVQSPPGAAALELLLARALEPPASQQEQAMAREAAELLGYAGSPDAAS